MSQKKSGPERDPNAPKPEARRLQATDNLARTSAGGTVAAGGVAWGLFGLPLEQSVIYGFVSGFLTGAVCLVAQFARDKAEAAEDGSLEELGWKILGLIGG